MLEKVDFLVRFWELTARHATLGEPLGPPEQMELLSLMQLVTSDLRIPKKGPLARTSQAVPAQLIGDGTSRSVEIRAVTAAAVLVASASAVPVGAQVILRIADAVAGVEYTIPCVVEWTHTESPCSMALVVDGIPTRATFDRVREPAVRPALFTRKSERYVG